MSPLWHTLSEGKIDAFFFNFPRPTMHAVLPFGSHPSEPPLATALDLPPHLPQMGSTGEGMSQTSTATKAARRAGPSSTRDNAGLVFFSSFIISTQSTQCYFHPSTMVHCTIPAPRDHHERAQFLTD